MKKIKLLTVFIILALGFFPSGILMDSSASTVGAALSCSGPVTLTFTSGRVSDSRSLSSPTCYKINIPQNTDMVRIDFKVKSGKYDLYHSEKSISTLDNNLKMNRFAAITGSKSYGLSSPIQGTHTFLVVPLVGGSSFSINIASTTTSTAAYNKVASAGEEGVRFSQMNNQLKLSLDVNESLTIPFEALGPGLIFALVFPDPSTNLAVYLQNPDYPQKPVIYASSLGSFSQVLYEIKPGNFSNERHWELTINNGQKKVDIYVSLIWPGYPRQVTREENTDRYGFDYEHRPLDRADPELCRQICVGDRRCVAYTYSKPSSGSQAVCHLKSDISQPTICTECISGVVIIRQMTFEINTDRVGWDFKHYTLSLADPGQCSADCSANLRCTAFTYVYPGVNSSSAECYLKESVPPISSDTCCVSGMATFRTASFEQNTDRPGGDYTSFALDYPSPEVCRSYCQEDPKCMAFTYVQPSNNIKARCYLKSAIPAQGAKNGCISGVIKNRTLSMEYDIDRPRSDYARLELNDANPELCRIQCALDPKCVGYSYKKPGYEGDRPLCYLKNSVPAPFSDQCCITGVVK